MKSLALLCLLLAVDLQAGQQALFWNISSTPSVDRYEFKFGTNAGSYQQSVWVTNRLTASNTFTLPAGRWYAVAAAWATNGGVSDVSNEVMFDIPEPIVIRLKLSYAPSPDGPWSEDPDVPPWIVSATESRKFYKVLIER